MAKPTLSAQPYLTHTSQQDVAKLDHIRKVLDKAIPLAQGKVNSLEEFCQFVEKYSQQHEQYSITATLVADRSEAVGGFRFAVVGDREGKYTSGKYLKTQLDRAAERYRQPELCCEMNYIPSIIAAKLNIDSGREAQAAVQPITQMALNFDIDAAMEQRSSQPGEADSIDLDLDDTTRPEPSLVAPSQSSAQTLADQEEDWDESPISHPSLQNSAARPIMSPTRAGKSSQKTTSSTDSLDLDEHSHLETVRPQILVDNRLEDGEETDELNDWQMDFRANEFSKLSEQSIAFQSDAAQSSVQSADWNELDDFAEENEEEMPFSQALVEPDTTGRSPHNPYRQTATEELHNIAHRAATADQSLNGLNGVGLVGQAAILGYSTTKAVIQQARVDKAQDNLGKSWLRFNGLMAKVQNTSSADSQELEQSDSEVSEERIQAVADLAVTTDQRIEALDAQIDQLEELYSVDELDESSRAIDESSTSQRLESSEQSVLLSSQDGVESQSIDSDISTSSSYSSSDAASSSDAFSPSIPDTFEQADLGELKFDPNESIPKRLFRMEGYLQQMDQKVELLAKEVGLDAYALAGINAIDAQGQQNSDFESQKAAFDKLPTLRFDPNESIDERLDKIEQFLVEMNRKLDIIEAKVEALEAQAKLSQQSELKEKPLLLSDPLPTLEEQESIVTDGVAVRPPTWSQECGDRILSFAAATNTAKNRDASEPGEFQLSDTRFARIASSVQSVRVLVVDEQENTLYTAETTGAGKWQVGANNLYSERDERLMRSLPQTQSDYEQWQAAQTFVTKLMGQHPDAFTQRSGNFACTTAHATQESHKLCQFEVKAQDDKTLLVAKDSSNMSVFSATRYPQSREWLIEKCDLSREAMRGMVESRDRGQDVQSRSVGGSAQSREQTKPNARRTKESSNGFEAS